MIAHVKTQLARYKAPKRVVFVTEVPRSPNGKADYAAAKQYALDALGASATVMLGKLALTTTVVSDQTAG